MAHQRLAWGEPMNRYDLRLGDSREVLKTLADNSVDSVVCDPPYSLDSIVKRFGAANAAAVKPGAYGRASSGFMGQKWDTGETAFDPEFWAEVLRVLKPGGYLLAFGGTRTYHRLAVAIEDAGFEIRDQIGWVYGSGFPKSHDVSKSIDREAGAVREVISVGQTRSTGMRNDGYVGGDGEPETRTRTAPATDAAKDWEGWGTALKPAWEPICMARKPLIGTVAENVLMHGTGAINIAASRVPVSDADARDVGREITRNVRGLDDGWGMNGGGAQTSVQVVKPEGRWPANIIHDGSDEVLAAFPDAVGAQGDVTGDEPSGVTDEIYGKFNGRVPSQAIGDSGSAARFFYCAKASKADREEGCGNLPDAILARSNLAQTKEGDGAVVDAEAGGFNAARKRKNNHPTVKPTALMAYLCRLVTPPGGLVLDPFMGSGSTGKGAMLEGFRFIGIEREANYMKIAEARVASGATKAAANSQPGVRDRKKVAVAAGQNDLFGGKPWNLALPLLAD